MQRCCRTFLVVLCFLLSPKVLFANSPPSVSPEPKVTLITSGNSPVNKLRMNVAAGTKATLVMTVRLGIKRLNSEEKQLPKIPATKIFLETEVIEITPEGHAVFALELVKAKAITSLKTNILLSFFMKKFLSQLIGTTGQAIANSRGFFRDVRFTLPIGAEPGLQRLLQTLQDSISQMGAPLPFEEVGVGAKWIVEREIRQGNITLLQTATYTLDSFDGNKGNCSIQIENAGKPEIAGNVSVASSGSGKITFHLDQLIPAFYQIAIKSDMKTQEGEQEKGLSMSLHIKAKSK